VAATGRRGDKQRIAEWMQTHNTGVFDDFDDANIKGKVYVAVCFMIPGDFTNYSALLQRKQGGR
jgi:hypothetical protein